MAQPALIVFARAPESGRSKTRLVPAVAPDVAARLHRAMTADLLARLEPLKGQFDLELHTDAPTACWPAWTCRVQSGGNLGDRLLTALADRPRTIVVGSDAPTVPLAYLTELAASECDVSIGPAEDGGFYAIACRRVAAAIFDGVRWSTAETLADTVQAIESVGLSVALGREWYDVDRPADLARLCDDPEIGPETRAVLAMAGIGR